MRNMYTHVKYRVTIIITSDLYMYMYLAWPKYMCMYGPGDLGARGP